jgi:hypothetical protein
MPIFFLAGFNIFATSVSGSAIFSDYGSTLSVTLIELASGIFKMMENGIILISFVSLTSMF